MILKPTQSGGVIFKAEKPFASCRVEWDSEGNIVAESCIIRTDLIPCHACGVGVDPVADSCGNCKAPKPKGCCGQ